MHCIHDNRRRENVNESAFILIAAMQSEIKRIRFDGNQSVAIGIPNRKEIMRFILYAFAQA